MRLLVGKGRVSKTSVRNECSKGQCNWFATVPLAHQQDRRGRRTGAERTPVDATASRCQPVEWPARWLKIDTIYHHPRMRAVLVLQLLKGLVLQLLKGKGRRPKPTHGEKQKPRGIPRGFGSAGYRGHRFSRAATPHDSS